MLAVCAPPIVILAIECVARVVCTAPPAPAPDVIIVNDRQVREFSRYDPDMFYTLRQSATFDFQSWIVETNRFGTRDPAPPTERAPNSLRVVCLGDSTAFGNFTTYPRELQSLLAEAFPEKRVEVLNAGIPGSTSFMGLTLFRRDLAELRPDIVTFCYGYNDSKINADFRSDRERYEEDHRTIVRVERFLARFRFLTAIQKKFRGEPPEPPPPVNPHDPKLHDKHWRVPVPDHRDNVEALKRVCDGIGAKLVVIAQPLAVDPERPGNATPGERGIAREMVARFDALHAAEAEACKKTGASFFDLAKVFAKFDSDRLFLDPWPGRDSIHSNPVGLSLFAEELFGFLVESRLVPQPAKMPDLPRFVAAVPEFAAAAVRRADGQRDALVFATAKHGRTVAFRADWTEPACDAVEIDLPAPTARVSIIPVPDAPGEFIAVGTTLPGQLAWKSFTLAGGAGRFAAGEAQIPDDISELRPMPADFDGDGAIDAMFVATGPTDPPILCAFGRHLELLAAPMQVIASTMPRLSFCLARVVSPTRASLLAYSQGTKQIGGFLIGGKKPPNLPSIIGQLGVAWEPTTIVPGHFTRSKGLDEAAVLRGSALTVWKESMSFEQVRMPLRSTRVDPKLPPLAVVSLPTAASPRVFFASRAGDRIHVAEWKDGAIRTITSLQFP